MAFPALPNPYDVMANPFAAAQNFVGQVAQNFAPVPAGQRVTQWVDQSGKSRTVALGDGFIDGNELAQWAGPVQSKLQALEAVHAQEQYAQVYGQNNMGDMMPVMLVLLLGGGLGGTGTSTDTTTLLLLVMMMGGQGNSGFGGQSYGGQSDNSSMMLMMVLLLSGGLGTGTGTTTDTTTLLLLVMMMGGQGNSGF